MTHDLVRKLVLMYSRWTWLMVTTSETVKPLATLGELSVPIISLDSIFNYNRVFKYANKGYGIRFLPSYLSYLSTYTSSSQTTAIARGESLLPAPLSLQELSDDSRAWTRKCLDKYIKLDYGNRPFHWPAPHEPILSDKPVFSHAMLESYAQVTSEPLGRSCLTGFPLFMRHVALWEEEAKGDIVYVSAIICCQSSP